MEKIRYKVICPICKNNFDVAKSIFMEMGFNSGSCTCQHCKTHLHLECNEETKTMKSEEFYLYVERLKQAKEVSKDVKE